MLKTLDPYHSRDVERPMLGERHDPVAHGGLGPSPRGTLNAGQVAAFDRDGYLFLDGLFSEAEVTGILAEAEALRRTPRGEVILEPEGREVRSVFAVHGLSPVFRSLSRHPRLLDLARHLLGGEVYLHQTRVNYKPGFEGKEFYWHSDFETWHMEDGMPRMRALSCSINLTENNPFNGPVMVVPGSHRRYVRCVGETPENHYEASLRRQEIGVPDRESLRTLVAEGGIVAPVGPPGSVLIFDCNLMHGSNSNLSPWPRSNVFMVYNSVENALVEPFCGRAPRPEHIASRDFTPLP